MTTTGTYVDPAELYGGASSEPITQNQPFHASTEAQRARACSCPNTRFNSRLQHLGDLLDR